MQQQRRRSRNRRQPNKAKEAAARVQSELQQVKPVFALEASVVASLITDNCVLEIKKCIDWSQFVDISAPVLFEKSQPVD
eukprot:8034558-Alexandrium_andersonii.AAC.1